jgi:UrcA family protein
MKAFAMKSILSAAALAVSAGLSVSAAAEQIDETLVEGAMAPTATVTFNRAELATTEGRETVERKIRNAAEEVCGSRDLRIAGNLAAAARNDACYEDAVAQGMSQLNANQFASID